LPAPNANADKANIVIPANIRRSFSQSIRSRGENYFASGRVRSMTTNGAENLTATVSGSELYSVELYAARGSLSAECSCPYAADNGACKHVWATICAGDRNGMLAALLHKAGKSTSFVALSEDDEARSLGSEVDDEFDDEFDDDYLDDFESEEADESGDGYDAPAIHVRRPPGPAAKSVPKWSRLIENARNEMQYLPAAPGAGAAPWNEDRRIIYLVDVAAASRTRGIPIELATERPDGTGGWKAPVQFLLDPDAWEAAPDPMDRQIAQMLIGAPQSRAFGHSAPASRFVLTGAAIGTTLGLICQTGRCRIRTGEATSPMTTAKWDDGPPWKLHLRFGRASKGYTLSAFLRRDGAEMSLALPTVLHSHGVLLSGDTFARFDHGGAFSFVAAFRETPSIRADAAELPALLDSLFGLPRRPELELPPGTRVAESREPPVPAIVMRSEPQRWGGSQNFVDLFFLYGTARVRHGEGAASLFDRDSLTVRHRDLEFENAALARLAALGARRKWNYSTGRMHLGVAATKVLPMLTGLVMSGWRAESDGALYRASVASRATVRSGIDWFELDARVSFGDSEATLHDLLEAKRRNATTVLLADGSRGLIPVDWLERLGPLIAGGTAKDGTLRFRRSQTALLDAMLAAVPEATVDAHFERARTRLRKFAAVEAHNPPRSFRGALRTYQKEGLGWLHFLRDFGLGGCLADDMGLGKTVQVLALLDSRRRTPRKPRPPSIVVVPRSLVFNWLREAERFTPRLRVLDHTGIGRDLGVIAAGDVDVVLTTYGTLRRDAPELAAIAFDYAILDEAQAIKTASSASAKAARLLRAEHRLVMTGTPIENRLEELWSIFEFLNPGMFGSASAFGKLARIGGKGSNGVQPNRELLARALRPVILRRTKQQVARDLPAKTEQTLNVELEGAQRRYYDDLLGAYRHSVLERVDRVGLGRARMHVLEALLRLRQAACHPGLIDRRKSAVPSAKLDALLPAVEQVVAEGHKALVFSQFTTFLSLVRERLDGAGICYEYLDGKTRNRRACVDRFQSDADCRLFLISLKAGGHGLNLTAAEYVFILDPWWNPAVEAQAIDRAHRIGQNRRVIATRIVALNTIETKILELQESKRALADAILGQDSGVLSGIGRAELELLLAR
jgi:superfamily II DNA or RNA helicase